MKRTILFFILIQTSICFSQQFEGRLVYKVNYSGHLIVGSDSVDFAQKRAKNSDSFDTVNIALKGNSYVKTLNKKVKETNIVLIDQALKYTIVENNMTKEDLSFNNSIKNHSNYFGSIKSIIISDTIFSFQNQNIRAKCLTVEREIATETLIFSDSISKLNYNRNIINAESFQVYEEEISSLINKCILLFYKSEPKVFGSTTTSFQLINFEEKPISLDTFKVPPYKDEKGYKKNNKSETRFKYYTLL